VRHPTLQTLVLSLALLTCGTLLPGCTGDHSPTVENDGRVSSSVVVPR
jgi:hypothetical protein